MAQIIPFPGTAVAPSASPSFRAESKPAPIPFPVVHSIRKRSRPPKRNRPEDDQTIIIAGLAQTWTEKAASLAQTEPGSEQHLFALRLAEIGSKLPRNNLRVLTTAEDVRLGVWRLWRQVRIADIEWVLCDERRIEAGFCDDEDGRAHWAARQDEADERRWHLYERMIRVPARRLSDITSYKLDRRFHRGMGSIEWMRKHKPDLAAIIDDELARLAAEKVARKAARMSKRKGADQ